MTEPPQDGLLESACQQPLQEGARAAPHQHLCVRKEHARAGGGLEAVPGVARRVHRNAAARVQGAELRDGSVEEPRREEAPGVEARDLGPLEGPAHLRGLHDQLLQGAYAVPPVHFQCSAVQVLHRLPSETGAACAPVVDVAAVGRGALRPEHLGQRALAQQPVQLRPHPRLQRANHPSAGRLEGARGPAGPDPICLEVLVEEGGRLAELPIRVPWSDGGGWDPEQKT
mmetsp:Transcript_961/g.3412  ORF Transcript_961/g.3412 Transcript_961/m.3412 type:complete len:228 (+) Transcript_961:809-1492(+)